MTLMYQDWVRAVISSLKYKEIFQIAEILNISPVAIAGALAEEYSSQSIWKEQAQNIRVMWGIHDAVGNINLDVHYDILNDYKTVMQPSFKDILEDPELEDKFFHITLNDVGIGNLKIATVIGLLQNYLKIQGHHI